MQSNHSRRRFLALSAAAALSLAARTAVAAADPAAARIQAFYDNLVSTMKQGPELGVQGRFDKIAPALYATYDMPTMTKIACGGEWVKIPPEKQQALIAAFGRMSAAIYADRFTKFNGQQFIVNPTPAPHNADMLVKTQLVPSGGDPVDIDYLMRGSGSDWRVIDVFLAGSISELATRRSEFSAVLQSDGPDALIAKLTQRGDLILKPK